MQINACLRQIIKTKRQFDKYNIGSTNRERERERAKFRVSLKQKRSLDMANVYEKENSVRICNSLHFTIILNFDDRQCTRNGMASQKLYCRYVPIRSSEVLYERDIQPHEFSGKFAEGVRVNMRLFCFSVHEDYAKQFTIGRMFTLQSMEYY